MKKKWPNISGGLIRPEQMQGSATLPDEVAGYHTGEDAPQIRQ